MKARRYSNQSKEQIIGHLSNILNEKVRYTLTVDPLGICYTLKESQVRKKKPPSSKKIKLREDQKWMSKKQRKKSNTKKRIKPKIRTVKKGRTVKLQGRVY